MALLIYNFIELNWEYPRIGSVLGIFSNLLVIIAMVISNRELKKNLAEP